VAVPGAARLVSPGVVAVGDQRWTARDVVIATGSEPVLPPIRGLAELDGVWTTDDRARARGAGGRLLVLGAGAEGIELAQGARRRGREVVLVESAEHVLPREPLALGAALGVALERDGIEVVVGARPTAAHRDGRELVIDVDDGRALRADHVLVAGERRPRVEALGLDAVDVDADRYGIAVDARMAATTGVWAVGSVTGISSLPSVGRYQADVAAANILGGVRLANYDAVPRVVLTEPRAVAVGATAGRCSGSAGIATALDFVTLLSDGTRLTGAYAMGDEADAWLPQLTLAIRARVTLDVVRDTIQPSATFAALLSEALEALLADIALGGSDRG
jgi:dihydrolipoamide dehydrogenase